MQHSNRKILNILLIGLLMLGFGPAGLVYAHHCKGGHANDPVCDGGGGGDPSDFPVDLEFRDDVIDGIQSDINAFPDPDYVDGDPGVSTRIRDDGLLLINIAEPRALIFDFSNQTREACVADCKREEDIVTAGGNAGVAASVQVVDGANPSQHLPDNLLGMVEGETLNAEMKFGYGGGKNTPRFSMRFQFLTLGEPIDVAIAAFSTFVEITRTSQTSWFIEAIAGGTVPSAPGDQALLFSKFKQKGPVTQDEGTYTMPFGLEITCPTCP